MCCGLSVILFCFYCYPRSGSLISTLRVKLLFTVYFLWVKMADCQTNNDYPDTLQGFGYGFNKEGQLRKLHPDTNEPGNEGFEFNVTDDQEKNQRRYEALGEVITSLIINDCIKTGSQLPYIHRARELGYGVMILNTNDNSRTIEGKQVKIKNSEDPHKHALYVWETYVRKAKARHLAIVAHSYGGSVVMDLVKQFFDDFRKTVVAVAFTDSTHFLNRPNPKVMYYLQKVARNWVSSTEPLDTAIDNSSKDVPQVSAGTPKHERTSAAAFESVFDFVEQHFNRVSRSHEL